MSPIPLVAVLALVVPTIVATGCSGSDRSVTATAPTRPAETTPETTPRSSAPAKTVAEVEAEVLAELEAGVDPDVIGEIRFRCEGSGPVAFGDVLSCVSEGFVPSGEPIQPADFVVVVVSDDGTWAASGASGPPDWKGAVAGLNCNQFFDAQLARADVPPYDTPPGGKYAGENYLYTLAYFFAHDRPSVMDIDGNGVPCETVYPAEIVQQVWAGGIVTIP